MRYIILTLLLFSIHLGMMVANTLDLVDYQAQPATEWIQNVDKSNLENVNYSQGGITDQQDFGFGDFIKSIFYFILGFGLGVIFVPYTLMAFGIPSALTGIFSAIIYLLYVLALAEWIGNRNPKGAL